MKDIKLRQEAGKSYLVVEKETNDLQEYMVSMITQNRIEGFLPCRIAYDKAREMLYYDVTNKISLEQIYSDKYIDCSDIRKIFEKFSEIKKIGQTYLLEDKYYVFNPDYIYVDIETEEIQILYLPSVDENSNQYSKFSDFLLRRVEQNDSRGVKLAYMFYKMIGLETFSIEAFTALVDKEIIISEKNDYVEKSRREPMMNIDTDIIMPDVGDNSDISFVVPAILLICVFGTTVSFIFLRKTFVYAIYILISAIVLAVFFIVSLIKVICKVVQQKQDEEMKDTSNNITVEEYWEDEETQVFNEETQVFFEKREDEEADDLEREYIWKWKEKGYDKNYRMKTFPIVIGKLQGEVDCFMEDSSVSRIHAKLEKDGNRIMLSDIGSTNGVYVDGKKLLPGQRVPVVTTSSVRIGNVQCELCIR